jgi:hypothetical protein
VEVWVYKCRMRISPWVNNGLEIYEMMFSNSNVEMIVTITTLIITMVVYQHKSGVRSMCGVENSTCTRRIVSGNSTRKTYKDSAATTSFSS